VGTTGILQVGAAAKAAAALALAATIASIPRVAGAQLSSRPQVVSVTADNDAFDFWMPPWDRPDQEYTSGVRGTFAYGGRVRGRPWRWILRDTTRTSTRSLTLGQEIYTGRGVWPSESGQSFAAQPAQRPNAGWLYVEEAQRDSSDRVVEELALAAGVVGPPALGEAMQRFFHSLGPEFQRAVDWRKQLPFEPGVLARYTRLDRQAVFGDGERWRGMLRSRMAGSVGTILVAAEGGGEATAEVALGSQANAADAPRLTFTTGASVRLVLRDEFLDGTFFRGSDRVPRRLLVPTVTGGAAFQWRRMTIGYHAHVVGKQYDGQARHASWGSLEVSWQVGG
jgi:lipid A 3-O-deacylase